MRAKEFLRGQGVSYQERDVSTDGIAAREMMRRTRQMGVPVIADSEEAIVGFDLPRLQRMAARHKPGGGLGARVKDFDEGPGAYVGSVREASPADRAGVQAGDVIVELSGLPVSGAADLERIAGLRRPGQPTSMVVQRAGERRTVILAG